MNLEQRKKRHVHLNPARTLSVALMLLVLSLAVAPSQAQTTSGAPDRNTFLMRVHGNMSPGSAGGRAHGWATSYYKRSGMVTNQYLQINCAGLSANQSYHLMASYGTNGGLMHLADFVPGHSGSINLNYMMGGNHRFTTSNDPSRWWGTTNGSTSHMSWVIFPSAVTNWCDWGGNGGGYPHVADLAGSTGGTVGTGATVSMGGMGGSGGWGGTPGMGWTDPMGMNWPAMANWWSGMGNWWPQMTNWCWGYMSGWNNGAGSAGGFSGWWGSRVHGSSHQMPLPDPIAPVPHVNGVVVMDDNLQVVLVSDLTSPSTLQFQARADFVNYGVVPNAKGRVQVSATQKATHFMMSATGLAPSTSYYWAMNGGAVTSIATDAHGRFQTRTLFGSEGVMSIGGVWILDQHTNVVLSAAVSPL